MLLPLAGPESYMHKVEFAQGPGVLATSADPTNTCDPQMYKLGDGETRDSEKLALWVLSSLNAGDDLQANFEDTVIVWFDASCPLLGNLTDTLLVVRYGESRQRRGVALSDRVLSHLGLSWLRSPSEVMSRSRAKSIPEAVGHLSDDQEKRLKGFDRKQLTTVDLTLLNGIVLSEAKEIAYRGFKISKVDEALRAILHDTGTDQMDVWGVRVRANLLPLLFPVALLALAFSLLFRLRRIDPDGDLLTEPWVVVMPRGVSERIGAAVWSMVPLGAAAGVIWATWVHHLAERTHVAWRVEHALRSIGDGLALAWWFAQTTLFWSAVLELVAAVFLVKATGWMFSIGDRGRKQRPSHPTRGLERIGS